MPQPPLESTEFRQALTRWYRQSARDLPWRETTDPYLILVSELMLQQTQVTTVLAYYQRWIARFPTLRSLAAATSSEVLQAWEGLGYYRRAHNLHRCAQVLMAQYEGVFPRDLETLFTLPGVGRYTAGALASFAFDQPAPIVEANIARVLSRLLDLQLPIDSSEGRRTLWTCAEKLCQAEAPGIFNAALMELGALICTVRAPDCGRCPVSQFCCAKAPQLLPRKKARQPVQEIVENYAWIRQKNKLLLQQRTGARWEGLWTLPMVRDPAETKRLVATFRHPITRFLVQGQVFAVSEVAQPDSAVRWHRIKDLAALPMPSPHRRTIAQILEMAV